MIIIIILIIIIIIIIMTIIIISIIIIIIIILTPRVSRQDVCFGKCAPVHIDLDASESCEQNGPKLTVTTSITSIADANSLKLFLPAYFYSLGSSFDWSFNFC